MSYIYNLFKKDTKSQCTQIEFETKNQSTQSTQNTQSNQKLFLLYGARNKAGIEMSYLIGVFNDEYLVNLEKDSLDKELNLTSFGKTINNVYVYKHYIIECELNKNYRKDIEEYIYLR